MERAGGGLRARNSLAGVFESSGWEIRGSMPGVGLLLSCATAPFAAASRRSTGQSKAVRIKLPIRHRRDRWETWMGSRVDSPVPLFVDRQWSSDDIEYLREEVDFMRNSRSDESKLIPGYDNIEAKKFPVRRARGFRARL